LYTISNKFFSCICKEQDLSDKYNNLQPGFVYPEGTFCIELSPICHKHKEIYDFLIKYCSNKIFFQDGNKIPITIELLKKLKYKKYREKMIRDQSPPSRWRIIMDDINNG
jgi:hypothetical protein